MSLSFVVDNHNYDFANAEEVYDAIEEKGLLGDEFNECFNDQIELIYTVERNELGSEETDYLVDMEEEEYEFEAAEVKVFIELLKKDGEETITVAAAGTNLFFQELDAPREMRVDEDNKKAVEVIGDLWDVIFARK